MHWVLQEFSKVYGVWGFLLGVVGIFVATSANAFTVQSALTRDCHESITRAALAQAGWPQGAAPSQPTEQERRAGGELPFVPEPADPWELALLIGVRYEDVDRIASRDLVALAILHGTPENQQGHCLRGPKDDWDIGDERALSACRGQILHQVQRALSQGGPTGGAREWVPVALAFSGTVDLSLPQYPFRVGRALHTLQDSFSHSFREPEQLRVRSVLNFVDSVSNHLDPIRDGHPHLEVMDGCREESSGQQKRRVQATEASVALLQAIAKEAQMPGISPSPVGVVLDRYLTRIPGCHAGNGFCDAPEPGEAAGCSFAAAAPRGTSPGSLVALLLLFKTVRRQRRPCPPRWNRG